MLDEEGGVLFVKKPDGRATGDAFVLFKEESEALELKLAEEARRFQEDKQRLEDQMNEGQAEIDR